MYKTLDTICSNNIAKTSFSKYPCPSLPVPPNYQISPYDDVTNTSFKTRESFVPPVTMKPHSLPLYNDSSVTMKSHSLPLYNDSSVTMKPHSLPLYNDSSVTMKPHSLPLYNDSSVTMKPQSLPLYNDSSVTMKPHSLPLYNDSSVTMKPQSQDNISTEYPNYLLPVLDYRFNLREMCKQSILLEDHLSHREKRCLDCCMKHFLFLEGLCEEAITLDKNGLYTTQLQSLSNKIRQLQKLFLDNPVQNSHLCSQELRSIRKLFQPDVFGFIFDDNIKSCSGSCSI